MARILYSAPLSLFARKIEIALAEKALAFDREMVAFTQTRGYSPKHPAVLAANPKAQVPVLVDGDLTLFDSTVIFEYLEDAYPQPPLYPEGAAARARCRLLELESDEILLPPLRMLMHRSEPVTDAGKRAQQEFEAGKGEAALAGHFDSLDRRLGGQPFFCGERFTVADIALFMSLHFVRRLKGPLPAGDLAAWYQRVLARPSVAQAVAEIAAADRTLSQPLIA